MKIEKQKRHHIHQTSPVKGGTVSHHACAEILGAEVPLVAGYSEPENQVSEGYIYTQRDLLCIEHLAKLPVDRCIKSNRKADKVVKLDLRSPMNPESWWGKCPRRLTVGLSSREYTRYCLKTWVAKTGLFLSLTAMGVGIALNFWLVAAGIFVFLVSGLLNATSPVWYRDVSKEFTSVRGVSPGYLKKFDTVSEGDNCPLVPAAQAGCRRELT